MQYVSYICSINIFLNADKGFYQVVTSCYYFVSISGYVNKVKDVLFSTSREKRMGMLKKYVACQPPPPSKFDAIVRMFTKSTF